MIPPSIRLFTLGDVVLQGTPAESPGFLLNGRVIVNIRATTAVKLLKVVFQTEQCNRWLPIKRATRRCNEKTVVLSDILYTEPSNAAKRMWSKGSYEFFFQLLVPGSVCETMYTEHKQVSYEVRAILETEGALGAAQRTAVQPIAVKRIPYYGPVWESLANDLVHVTATWRNQIEMCAFGCSRVQRDGRPVRVKGVVRALEKGFKLTKVGFLLEERTRSRVCGGMVKSTGSVAASTYLRPKTRSEHQGWYGGTIVDQMAFEMELKIPKAYGKIQYDVKHGSVTVSHRLAFVVAVVDATGRGTSLRLFTPLHIMPHDWAGSGEELPSYISSFADRVLLRSIPLQHVCLDEEEYQLQLPPSPPPSLPLSVADPQSECTVVYSDNDSYSGAEAADNDGDSAIATDSNSADCVRISESSDDDDDDEDSSRRALGVTSHEWEGQAVRLADTVAVNE
ncbi:hypothetical protein IW140_000500 [Coemansia sp. RSA 1813]|nr:hypothetical protein EV178_004010 [Coemansia sp. RSA 1646]KAJ1773965.1 hypothetical protein LPJ74_000064 [Coemansia sp. RSA 1843]KAJ2092641.1 hypothetical protein IW138_001079 [Coemansia sp. RSA 986]KAJ2213400.1 hypothetical protein EV179_003909 [Coemansia sp. RSA 487]KAJ2572737.1 hypothetical protein IW140_000500 [Coemansia sp. RSA 1813]